MHAALGTFAWTFLSDLGMHGASVDRSLLLVEMREHAIHETKMQILEKIPGVLWARFLPHISHYTE